MIIVIGDWKKKVLRVMAVILLVGAFAAAAPALTGLLHQQVPAIGRWFEDEHPTGNPMRVEKEQDETKFDQVMDQFVIKLQEFYYEE